MPRVAVWRKALPYAVALAAAGAAKPLAAVLWEMFWFTNLGGFLGCMVLPGGLLVLLIALAAGWRQAMAWLDRITSQSEKYEIPVLLAIVLIPLMAFWGYGHGHLRADFSRHRPAFESLADAASKGTAVVPATVGRWKVLAVEADPRGGVYIATGGGRRLHRHPHHGLRVQAERLGHAVRECGLRAAAA